MTANLGMTTMLGVGREERRIAFDTNLVGEQLTEQPTAATPR